MCVGRFLGGEALETRVIGRVAKLGLGKEIDHSVGVSCPATKLIVPISIINAAVSFPFRMVGNCL